MEATASVLCGKSSYIFDDAIADSPLLHPSLTVTVFEAVVHVFAWFSSHPSISKEAFSKNLEIWHSILPQDNLLPKSYKEAYQLIKPFLIPEIIFHVCPNDCIFFRGEYKDNLRCPKCNSPRFKTGKIPTRTFHYLPLGPRLARNFGTKDISCILQSHSGEKPLLGNDGNMNDIHDSPTWKTAFSENGTFKGDPRGVGLSLCLDGLNPWSKNKANYSMWPIVLGQLNLPRSVRLEFGNLILAGIIPSQVKGKEPKHLDPYLEVLVDEIAFLSGSKIYDAYKEAPFHAKVEILIHILDFQGLGKVFSLTGTGSYRSCGWCMVRGIYCKHLCKVVYPGNRRFLPADHELRFDSSKFPEQSEERRERPEHRSFEMDTQFHKAFDNAKNNEAQRKRIATGTGCRGMYVLADKNPLFDRVQQTMPDAMHTIAVQMKHLVKCLAGKEPEDCVAVRMQEKELGRFKESWSGVAAKTNSSAAGRTKALPAAPFGLTKKEMEEADRRVKEIITPAGDSFIPGPIFSNISKLNSHHWKEVNITLAI